MPEVRLRFPPAPSQVRIARLVAASVAHRAGLDHARVDELRLAVGEACARAVRRCTQAGIGTPVSLLIEDAAPGVVVEVRDGAGPDGDPDAVVLALLRGLADAVEILGHGDCLRLEWFPSGHDS